ncbi:MAG: FtsX-like permease family protein [Woeseiaceae bacterium]|nr:FtsX-like permease family protein [Woeseiaceae bacterium]
MILTLRLAWRNLWRHARRTWLTIGAMVFSNVLLVFMISFQFSVYDLMINNSLRAFSGHMQVQAPGYIDDGSMRQTVAEIVPLASRLRQDFPDADIAARASGFVLASSEQRSYGIAVYGVEPAFEPSASSIPGLVTDGRFVESGDEVIIGTVLARNLRVSVGDELTMLGSGRDGSFAAAVMTIVGIFDSGIPDLDRSIAEIPLATFQEVFYMRGSGHQIVINAPTIDSASDYRQRIRALLPDDLELHDWTALQPGLKQAITADLSSSFFVYGVLVILVAFSVLNTGLMSVLERTREFGILMALGIAPGRLGRLVLLETALMGAIGILLGALLGGILTAYFGVTGFVVPGMEEMAVRFNLPARLYPGISVVTLFAGPFVVFLVSILATLYPAFRLNRLQPVEAMRAA